MGERRDVDIRWVRKNREIEIPGRSAATRSTGKNSPQEALPAIEFPGSTTIHTTFSPPAKHGKRFSELAEKQSGFRETSFSEARFLFRTMDTPRSFLSPIHAHLRPPLKTGATERRIPRKLKIDPAYSPGALFQIQTKFRSFCHSTSTPPEQPPPSTNPPPGISDKHKEAPTENRRGTEIIYPGRRIAPSHSETKRRCQD